MYVSGVNIVVTYPDTPKTLEALQSLDFLVVATHMMNPTAEYADLVLPKTTGLEDEEVSAGGLRAVPEPDPACGGAAGGGTRRLSHRP